MRERAICKFCGREFISKRKGQIFCSDICCGRFSRGNCPTELGMSSEKRAEKRAMLARLRARDEAYAKAFPADARGSVRGRRIVASKCGTINDACGFIRTFG